METGFPGGGGVVTRFARMQSLGTAFGSVKQAPGPAPAPPAPAAPAFSISPAIIGTPQVGVASAYTSGTYSGYPPPTSTQQWTLDGVDISGATGTTYTPVSGDAGKLLRVRQTATNGVGSPANSTSASVAITSVPAFSVAPAIIGTPQVGVASAYTSGTFSGSPTPTSSQQWTLDGVDISGATSTTYTPVVGDVGKALRVRQIASNGVGSPATSTSASATVIAATSSGIAPLAPNIESLVGGASGQAVLTWALPTTLANNAVLSSDPLLSLATYWGSTEDQQFPGGSGTTKVNISNPALLTTTISGLTPGATIWFGMTATNASNESDASAPESLVIP